MKIGFIGIGLMGGPLARNLIRAGREVSFFARNKEHIEKTLSVGTTGKLVSSVRDLHLPAAAANGQSRDDGRRRAVKSYEAAFRVYRHKHYRPAYGRRNRSVRRTEKHSLSRLHTGARSGAGGTGTGTDFRRRRQSDFRQVQRYSGYHRFARPLSRRRKTGLRFQDYQQYGRHDQSGRLSRRNSSGAALRHRYKPVFGTARHDRRRLQSAAPPRPADY